MGEVVNIFDNKEEELILVTLSDKKRIGFTEGFIKETKCSVLEPFHLLPVDTYFNSCKIKSESVDYLIDSRKKYEKLLDKYLDRCYNKVKPKSNKLIKDKVMINKKQKEYRKDHKLAKLLCLITNTILFSIYFNIDNQTLKVILFTVANATYFFGVNSFAYLIEKVLHHKHKHEVI